MKQEKEFKVIRSYERGTGTNELQELFDSGWQLERASEYIPPRIGKNNRCITKEYYGYIEYILSRPIKSI